MALGASSSNFTGLVVRHGLTLTAFGLALGLAGSWASTRALKTALYGISTTDPTTFGAVTADSDRTCSLPDPRAPRRPPRFDRRSSRRVNSTTRSGVPTSDRPRRATDNAPQQAPMPPAQRCRNGRRVLRCQGFPSCTVPDSDRRNATSALFSAVVKCRGRRSASRCGFAFPPRS